MEIKGKKIINLLSEFDSLVFVKLAVFFMLGSVVSLIFHNRRIAENFAAIVYFLLILSVFFQIPELRGDQNKLFSFLRGLKKEKSIKPKKNHFTFSFSALKNRFITLLNIIIVAFYILIFGLDVRQNYLSLILLLLVLIFVNFISLVSHQFKKKKPIFDLISKFKIDFIRPKKRNQDYFYILIINLSLILTNLLNGRHNFFVFLVILFLINFLIIADLKNKKYS